MPPVRIMTQLSHSSLKTDGEIVLSERGRMPLHAALRRTLYNSVTVAAALNLSCSSSTTGAGGQATRLVFSSAPLAAFAAATIATPVVVAAVDNAGNTDASFAGIIGLSIGTNPVGGTLSGTISKTAIDGVASFDDLSIDLAGSGYTVVATSLGLEPVTSPAFDVSPVTQQGATSLLFTTAPANVNAGATLASIQVAAVDDSGQLDGSFISNITIGIGTNPGGATLSGTTVIAAIAGSAIFGDLSLDQAGTGYTLVATAAGLTPDTSTTFNVINVSGATGILTGLVTIAGSSQSLAGGKVAVRSAGTVVTEIAVGSDGSYSSVIPVGSYQVTYYPPITHASSPGQENLAVTVSDGNTTTQDFTAITPLYIDDLESYGSVQDLINAYATNNTGQDFALDSSAAEGSQAVRYNWPGGACGTVTIQLQRTLNTSAIGQEVWVRWYNKWQSGFEFTHGGSCPGGESKKQLLVGMGPGIRFALLIHAGGQHVFRGEIPGIAEHQTDQGASSLGMDPTEAGAVTPAAIADDAWHEFVMRWSGFGTTNGSYTLWIDGILVSAHTGLNLTNHTTLGEINLGANINQGLRTAGSEWWDHISVFVGRPSFKGNGF